MWEGGLILNVCLIALVATSPIPQQVDVQTYPGIYCDQIAFRNSLIGLLKREYTRDKSSVQIEPLCPNLQNDLLKKVISDKIISNPLLVDFKHDVQRSENDVISKNIPNIVNNYIILPPDIDHGRFSYIDGDGTNRECKFNNQNICTRVKKDAGENAGTLVETENYNQTNEVTNRDTSQLFVNNKQKTPNGQFSNNKMLFNTTTTNQKRKIKKSFKRPSQTKGEPIKDSKNIDTESLDIESGNKVVNKTKNIKIKSINRTTQTKEKVRNHEDLKYVDNSYKDAEKIDQNQYRNRSVNSTNSRNKINGSIGKHGNLVNGKHTKTQTYEGRKKKLKNNEYTRPKEKQSNLNDDNKKQKYSNNNRSSKTYNSVPINKDYPFPNMPYDSTSMYKYIEAIMSNYQLSNKHDFPFNFNNYYQLPQLSNTWNSKQQSRSKSQRRRKHPKLYRRKQNRKRVYSKRKPTVKKVDTWIDEIDVDSGKIDIKTPTYSLEMKESPYIAIIQKDNETIISIDSEQKNNASKDEIDKENIITTIFDELSFMNNSLSEETFYNSSPSFIVGMDDKIPIIFEKSLMDDYYPDFTADNESLLTTDEKHPVKYHGDKYHYVSNKNFDFGDYIKERKRIAMKNFNQKINLFSSDNKGNQNLTTINHEGRGNKDLNSVQFLSPFSLAKPDFRTRKIDTNEIYEPYYHHNIYEDPEENLNNYEDDKAVVYPTPISSKENKTKSCNDIEDALTKWKKSKDSNVETVYARSKLAKYGHAL